MPKVAAFYSVNETTKEAKHRVHHNNGRCGAGKSIPTADVRLGTGPPGDPYRLCDDCQAINKEEARS